jgi:hypothetical protein
MNLNAVAFLTPSPVVGEGWGEGTFTALQIHQIKTLSLTLPHNGGENKNGTTQ